MTATTPSSSSQPPPPPPPLPLPPSKVDQEQQTKLIDEAKDCLNTNVQLGNQAEIESHLHRIKVDIRQKFIDSFHYVSS